MDDAGDGRSHARPVSGRMDIDAATGRLGNGMGVRRLAGFEGDDRLRKRRRILTPKIPIPFDPFAGGQVLILKIFSDHITLQNQVGVDASLMLP